jgi:hypothetical protein
VGFSQLGGEVPYVLLLDQGCCGVEERRGACLRLYDCRLQEQSCPRRDADADGLTRSFDTPGLGADGYDDEKDGYEDGETPGGAVV